MRDERGHAPAIEAAVIIPGLVLIIGLIVVLAQVSLAQQDLRAIASSAARAAALERSPAAGERNALEVVERGLAQHGVACASRSAAVDAAGLAAPLGTEAEVTVRLRCTVALSEVTLPLLPGSVALEVEADSPVDRYRAR
jgi:Flp pilus assembly protein TadG